MFNHPQSDLHIHTIVSDGASDAPTMLEAAQSANLKVVSITDHDAIGAYRHFVPDLFTVARSMGLELISGIELDTEYMGRELHLLGYGIDIDNIELNAYLGHIQDLRRQRICEQIEAINSLFGQTVLSQSDIFLPHRDTLMKPHLIHTLLQTNQCGDNYHNISQWLTQHIRTTTKVPKLPIISAIEMMHNAGGKAVLAHPAFLAFKYQLSLKEIFADLRKHGLDGVEAEYPYSLTAKQLSEHRSISDVISEIQELAKQFGLFTTRGSDAHDPHTLTEFATH